MKFLDLFGKSSDRHVKNVRTPNAQADDERRATARKIDAIESEITAELDAQVPENADSDRAQQLEQRITEASILHASRQAQPAESLLLEAVSTATGDGRENIAWMMLLELASFRQDRDRFESLSLRYAERFETSPPQWRVRSVNDAAENLPTLAFRGKLLASSGPALAQFERMAQTASRFVIDLRGVTDIDSAGCSALLVLFKRWEAQHKEMAILPAPSLLALLHGLAQREGKDADDSLWHLLLELLRISGDEKAYENACVDYSIRFELSPPAPLGFSAATAQASSDLRLPEEIVMPVDALLDALRAAAESMDMIVFDCSQLRLVEFNAAAALLGGITGLAKGKPVEWRDIPHLVSTLLQLVGGEGKSRFSHRQP